VLKSKEKKGMKKNGDLFDVIYEQISAKKIHTYKEKKSFNKMIEKIYKKLDES
jgi:hypothetical protein